MARLALKLEPVKVKTQDQSKVIVGLFSLFCLLHLILWTAVPLFFSFALPHDVAEAVAWGLQGQWGYDKHPPLNAWLCAVFFRLGGIAAVYLWAQVVVVLSFIAVWKLARECVSEWQSLIAVLLLAGVSYFTLDTPNLTPDTLQTPLWAWIAYLFYRVLTAKKTLLWIPLGILMGLAILAKYQSFILFFCMGVVFLCTEEGRKNLGKPWPYITLFIILMVASPHIYWLSQHHWITLNYLENSTTGTLHANEHNFLPKRIEQPLRFLLGALAANVLLIACTLLFPRRKEQRVMPTVFQKRFIAIMAFGPLCVTLLYGFCFDSTLEPRWATPYFSLWGIAAMLWLQPDFSDIKIRKRILGVCFALLLLLPIGRVGYLVFSPYVLKKMHADDYFPAQLIANTLDTEWHTRYHTPVPYVIGSHYMVTYFSVYSNDHPKPFMDFNLQECPWIDIADVKRKGALVIFKSGEDFTSVLNELKKEFPTMTASELQSFPKAYLYLMQNKRHPQVVSLTVFFVPPIAVLTSTNNK